MRLGILTRSPRRQPAPPSLFTLTVRTAGGEILARQESLPGEDWPAMLARIHEALTTGGDREGGLTDGPEASMGTLIFETEPHQL